jgi:LDH2 family malate/lactate/ureidoglycolate dehydrogenase
MTLSHLALEDFAYRILTASGVSAAKSKLIAQSLVAANLRGVDSHGVQLLPFYVNQLLAGNIDAQTDGAIASENGCVMVYDAQNGLGAPVSEICCNHVNRLAAEHGMGIVVTRESNHFGACAWWAQRISAAGNIGIVMCNASPMVAPWQAKEPRLGTNPICMSVPGPPDKSWLLDMATTTVAAGKIYKAGINGVTEIPAGWAIDSDGRPTTSTDKALNGGMVMPLGGYKGSGLAMMVEILCAVLSGGAMSTELGGIRIKGRPMRVSQLFLAIDVRRFMSEQDFDSRIGRLVEMVKSAAAAPDYDEVLVAGEPEIRSEEERRRDGIPIPDGVWNTLLETAARWQVKLSDA